MIFPIKKDALTHLKKLDAHMNALITHLDYPEEQQIEDGFFALCDIIIGQQISETAKAAIMKRFKDAFSPITKARINQASLDDLRGVGLSKMKAMTMQRLSASDMDFTALKHHDTDTIRKTLLAFKGIGQWSVDMFFFVAMGLPDILSVKDIGIINGIMRLYGVSKETAYTFENYFSPYGSTAASYLWKLLEVDDATLEKIKKDVKS